jgi:hypothetical protein
VLPTVTTLLRPAPNPFAGAADVRFDLAASFPVRLTIFDATGRIVRVLADERLDPGRYARPWDGRDRAGNAVPPGVYLLRFDAGPVHQTRRLIRIGG